MGSKNWMGSLQNHFHSNVLKLLTGSVHQAFFDSYVHLLSLHVLKPLLISILFDLVSVLTCLFDRLKIAPSTLRSWHGNVFLRKHVESCAPWKETNVCEKQRGGFGRFPSTDASAIPGNVRLRKKGRNRSSCLCWQNRDATRLFNAQIGHFMIRNPISPRLHTAWWAIFSPVLFLKSFGEH